ncbi:hypothetical protein J1605_012863 [Eschrichtius robustus]|uniref:P-type phospholipid transporter n=1 Tax=Eschrichtius robustus TaxID=9764 RepID=A0AB34GFK6_ESCRO|nr:hypothetical protein J1605_012863 [Eschrichtius robustus]
MSATAVRLSLLGPGSPPTIRPSAGGTGLRSRELPAAQEPAGALPGPPSAECLSGRELHRTVVGVVLYTGRELRSVMNTSNPRSKIGLFDLEVNCLTKILFGALVVVSLVMVALQHFAGRWYLQIIRFLLLFSNIIPISLRVNLDMGKIVYSWVIRRDSKIPGTVVRSSTIPEQLGRISYLLTDKTGTLTQNEMVFKRLHLGTVAYGLDSMDEVQSHIFSIYTQGVLLLSSFCHPIEADGSHVCVGPTRSFSLEYTCILGITACGS